MREDNNITVSKHNNKIVTEDINKIVIEYNNTNDDNDDDNNNDSDNDNGSDNNDKDYNDKIKVEEINNDFKKVDETRSFEDQINTLKEIPWLDDYWYTDYYKDNKEINLRLFKSKFAHVFNDVDDNLFE